MRFCQNLLKLLECENAPALTLILSQIVSCFVITIGGGTGGPHEPRLPHFDFWGLAPPLLNFEFCLIELVFLHNFYKNGVILHGMIFSKVGHYWIFPKAFLGGESGEIRFLPLETKKTAFLLKFSNSCPPSDTHACV